MSVRVLLLIIAVICFAIAFILSAGWVTGLDPHTLGYLGLGCFAGAHLTS